jgi:phage protein U
MSLGPVVFNLVSNLTAHEKEQSSAFAKHEVVGSAPVYEAMGDGEGSFSLSGVIHPEHFGGMGTLSTLEAARAAEIPLPLMRGDFTPLGWVLIDKLKEESSYLNGVGIGREIRFTVSLIRVGTPDFGMASSILRLFL